MKKLMAILVVVSMLLCLYACGEDSQTMAKKQSTAQELVTSLQNAKLPITNVQVYTSSTDPNSLLGRPKQYISKVSFADSRLEQSDANHPTGGSIEVFSNTQDLTDRKTYLENIQAKMPGMMEYIYANGNYLLRLNKLLTPEQADLYEKEFMKLL